MRKRFVRESKVAASIDHPNVIPIYYAGEEDGVAYIAMRYVPGDDLRSLVRRERKLEPRRAARLIAQVAAALDAAHAAGLVHRDVKPANVLLGPDEHVYLTDFGLTKHALSIGGATKPGHWVGTLDYVAPEQIRGERVDARADVYALGCVLYYALTGHVPFEREGDEARLWAHLSEDPPKPSERVPRLPAELDEVVARALAKSPDDRFPSAGDLGRAAVAAVAGERPREHERLVAVGAAAPVDSPTVTSGRLAATRVQGDDAAEAETRVVHDADAPAPRGCSAGVVAAALAAGIAVGAFALNSGDDSPGQLGRSATPTPTATAHGGAVGAGAVGRTIKVGDRPNVRRRERRQRLRRLVPRAAARRSIDPRRTRSARAGRRSASAISDDRGHEQRPSGSSSRASDGSTVSIPRPGRRRGAPIDAAAAADGGGDDEPLGVGRPDHRHAGRARQLAQIDRRSGADRQRTFPVPEGISALADRRRRDLDRQPPLRAAAVAFDPRRQAVTQRVPVGTDRPFDVAFGAGAVWVTSPQRRPRLADRPAHATAPPDRRGPQPAAASRCAGTTSSSPTPTTTRSPASTRARAGRSASRSRRAVQPVRAVAIEGDSVWVTCQPRRPASCGSDYEPLTDRGG